MIIILVLTILTCLYYFVHKRRNYWRDSGVPYMKSALLPFRLKVGNSAQKVHPALSLQFSYNTLKSKQENLLYGGIFFFLKPIVLAIDLDFIKNVLVKDFQYFHDRGLYYNEEDDPISAHLLNIEGTRWRNLRAKLTPTFSSAKMKMMFPTVIDVGHQFEEYLRETLGDKKEIVEMKDVLARFTTDVIGSCAFGLECNSLKDPNTEFRLMGKKSFDDPKLGAFSRLFVLTFRSLSKKLHFKIVHDDVSAFFMGVVKDTIEYREKNNIQRNDFMNLLIKLKNSGRIDDEAGESNSNSSKDEALTVNEITAQAFVFFMAGFETSSTAMSYALYELSQNINVQERARKCVRDSLSKHGGKWSYEAVSEMTYIDQCINESLRKYPPASNIIRLTTKDYPVPGTENIIKKGMAVMFSIYGIHHDPEYYPNPEIYDPDRFSAVEASKRHPMAFIPFGEGPRICIGLRFGMMQARIGLAILLNSFQFTTCSKTVIPMKFSTETLILTPADGLFLNVCKI